MRRLGPWPTSPHPRATPASPPSPTRSRWCSTKVADILRKINFGTVVLVVQDGKVVQIEMAEKFRLR